jgi:hypothetical protein
MSYEQLTDIDIAYNGLSAFECAGTLPYLSGESGIGNHLGLGNNIQVIRSDIGCH